MAAAWPEQLLKVIKKLFTTLTLSGRVLLVGRQIARLVLRVDRQIYEWRDQYYEYTDECTNEYYEWVDEYYE